MKRVTRTIATVLAALSISLGVAAVSATPAQAFDTSWGTSSVPTPVH